MEGWLHLIRSNLIGFEFSRKRYYLLQGHHLHCFKSAPNFNNKDPIRSSVIDSCIRVMDNGGESIQRKVFFVFTLHNTSDPHDQVKLGASSPEEAARWIQAFREAALQHSGDTADCLKHEWHCSRLSCSSKVHGTNFVDWTASSASLTDTMHADDVNGPSPWTIFGCHNGIRLFKEARDRECRGKRGYHPALMAVGLVHGTSEAIFQTLMSLGSSRSRWDFCFHKGNVIEHLDGHTDVVHILLKGDLLHWGMKRRDLLLQRHWSREDDGTYVILYHSVFHKKCPPQKGYVRACLKSGGYVISPVNGRKQSVVKHMLAIDWKFWKSYLQESSSRSITIRMLGRLAALRELFRASLGDYSSSSELSLGELMRDDGGFYQRETTMNFEGRRNKNEDSEEDMDDEVVKSSSNYFSLVGLEDAADDEFFDVSEPLYNDDESNWSSNFGPEMYSQDIGHSKLSTAAGFVKKLHGFSVQKRDYTGSHETLQEDIVLCNYEGTLPKDPTSNLPCSWADADASTFQIRGETFLQDHKKINAKGTLMQIVAIDWLRSDKREDDLAGRPGSIVQKFAANGRPEFFFIVNMQVPGSTTYSIASYFMMSTPMEDAPLLESFIKGDDEFRNSRFKLIPHVYKGPWIVKQTVGSRACLVGQLLKMNYVHGKNYLEVDIDVGSSTFARGVAGMVFSYFSNLIIEMAFLIQANTNEELPEYLLGTYRLSHLDASKSVLVKP